MKIKNIKFLKCANCKSNDLSFVALKINRNGKLIRESFNVELNDSDYIKSGFLKCDVCESIFPIYDYITILLSDSDIDVSHAINVINKLKKVSNEENKNILDDSLKKYQLQKETRDGIWNREEMEYYDKDVDSEDKRKKMINHIKNYPVWKILIPRKNFLIDLFPPNVSNLNLLEVGCGNSRTIYKLLPPEKHNYNYIGMDISFKRLLVAKEINKVGTFIQGSAMNLPFKDNFLDGIIGFGVYHHLPEPAYAIKSSLRKIKSSGFIGFHEPLEKVKQIIDPIKYKKLLDLTSVYEHSEHDNEINMDEVLNKISDIDFKDKSIHYYGTTVMTILYIILGKIRFLHKIKLSNQIIFFIDKIFYNLFCRSKNRFGPTGVVVYLRKK